MKTMQTYEVDSRKLSQLRLVAGWTFTDLSEKSGVDRVTLFKAEHGKTQSQFKTLRKIAGAYGVAVEELIKRTNGRKPKRRGRG